MTRRAHYIGNGKDDVAESEFDIWDGLPPIDQASRTMQERLLKRTSEDAKALARKIIQGDTQ